MFCKRCWSILFPKKENGNTILQCSCGFKEVKEGGVQLKEQGCKEENEVAVIEKEVNVLPICDHLCVKCGNNKAYYEIKQMRSADEPPSKFTKCIKCGHTERDDS